MSKKGKPPVEERKKILHDLEVARSNFVLDPSLVRFYHVKKGKSFKSIGVTVVKTSKNTFVISAGCRRHSSDFPYGPRAEKIILQRLDSSIREEINDEKGLIPEGEIRQHKVSIKRDSFDSDTIWDCSLDTHAPYVSVIANIEQFRDIKGELKEVPSGLFKVKARAKMAERLPE